MSDISKCSNNKCPSRNKCYRYTCEPSKYWQAYSDFKPGKGKKKCEAYWKAQ